MDPRLRLERISRSASGYSINLNDQVDRVLSRGPLRGSRALVYNGIVRPTGKKVAIKVFRFGPPSDENSIKVGIFFLSDSLQPKKYIQRVLHEVSTWTKLRHRNIVPVSGITTTFDYTISLITEWADGGSAIDYVQNRVVDPRPLVSVITKCQIACYL